MSEIDKAACMVVYRWLHGDNSGGMLFPDEETAKRVTARAKELIEGLGVPFGREDES